MPDQNPNPTANLPVHTKCYANIRTIAVEVEESFKCFRKILQSRVSETLPDAAANVDANANVNVPAMAIPDTIINMLDQNSNPTRKLSPYTECFNKIRNISAKVKAKAKMLNIDKIHNFSVKVKVKAKTLNINKIRNFSAKVKAKAKTLNSIIKNIIPSRCSNNLLPETVPAAAAAAAAANANANPLTVDIHVLRHIFETIVLVLRRIYEIIVGVLRRISEIIRVLSHISEIIGVLRRISEIIRVLRHISEIINPLTEEIDAVELAKAAFATAIPITFTILYATSDGEKHFIIAHFLVTGLSTGRALIWIGFRLKNVYPNAAVICEHLGIILVFVSINGLVTFAVPKSVMWLPMLCGVAYFVPYVAVIVTDNTSNQVGLGQAQADLV